MNASVNLRSGDEVRKEFARRGLSISAWARAKGFSVQLVYQVLRGKKQCLRGQSHEIAVRLGIKAGEIGSIADIDALCDTSKAIASPPSGGAAT